MNYKEKLKDIINSNKTPFVDIDTFLKYFPELKDIENEKIRKALINKIRRMDSEEDFFADDYDAEQLCNWLEKQGGQKPADKVEPKFKVGDVIKPKDGGHEPWQIMQVDILDKKYRFKDGYVIHFSQEDNYELVEQNAWSEEDEYCRHQLIVFCENCMVQDSGARRCADWLKSLKDRVQPKQESDERNRLFGKLEEWLDEYVSDLADVDTATLIESFSNYLDGKLLKSPRPRNRWKPTKRQLLELSCAISGVSFDTPVLVELEGDLKKLMEE